MSCVPRVWSLLGSCSALLELARGPKVSRLRSGVLGHLSGAWRDGAAGQQFSLGLVPADADRDLRRADTPARASREKALDAAILERVERDRGEAAVGVQQIPGDRQ